MLIFHPPIETTSTPAAKSAITNRRRPVSWETRLAELGCYKQTNGSCRVPKNYPVNHSLASWCDNQRRQRKLRLAGKTSSLTLDREATLTEMGFWWEFGGGTRVQMFDEWLGDLAAWTTKYSEYLRGRLITVYIVNKDEPSKDESLAHWLRNQVERYQSGVLAPEREVVNRLPESHQRSDESG